MQQHYFIPSTRAQSAQLKKARVPFEVFKIKQQDGLMFDHAVLQRALTALNAGVAKTEKSPYEGIEILHLDTVAPARRTSRRTPAITANVAVEGWSSQSRGTEEKFVAVAKQFATVFGVRSIILNGQRNGSTPQRPRANTDNLNIFFWSSAKGEARSGLPNGDETPNKLFGHEIYHVPGHWRIWTPSGLGITIKDPAGYEVAELVGENLYIHYPIDNLEVPEGSGPAIFRKLLEEVAVLRRTSSKELAKKLAEADRLERERIKAEVAANPVVVERWRADAHLKNEFIAVAKDFVRALGGKQIVLLDYCRNVDKMPAAGTGKVHIGIWTSPLSLDSGGTMQKTLFGLPLSWDRNGDSTILRLTGGEGWTTLVDQDGNQFGEMKDDSIYISYPLLKEGLRLTWDGKGPAALFRKMLEEVAFERTATPKQKAARAREIAKKFHAQSREAYVKACAGRFDADLTATRQVISDNPTKVLRLQQDIVRLIREVDLAQAKIENLEGKRGEAANSYGLEFDKLLASEKVRDVRVDGSVIKVFTDTLYCVDPRTDKKHEIGHFRIEIELGGSVRWFNLARTVAGYESRMHAPHVHSNGEACLGNMSEVVPELVAKYEFAALVSVCIQFVESVNVNDRAGQYVNKWPLAA